MSLKYREKDVVLVKISNWLSWKDPSGRNPLPLVARWTQSVRPTRATFEPDCWLAEAFLRKTNRFNDCCRDYSTVQRLYSKGWKGTRLKGDYGCTYGRAHFCCMHRTKHTSHQAVSPNKCCMSSSINQNIGVWRWWRKRKYGIASAIDWKKLVSHV